MTKDELIAFEADIAAEFNAGKIRAPIHLDGGNEDALIDYFAHTFRPGDWVCCTWRSHYKALLAGVPPEKVKAEIMAGRSISLCIPEHRIISSAIVGGILPIALGLAWAIKRQHVNRLVHAFVGDMAARSGMFHECREYACGHQLPINFIVEDNGKSVGTPTHEVWRAGDDADDRLQTWEFTYTLPWPHSGAGKRIEF